MASESPVTSGVEDGEVVEYPVAVVDASQFLPIVFAIILGVFFRYSLASPLLGIGIAAISISFGNLRDIIGQFKDRHAKLRFSPHDVAIWRDGKPEVVVVWSSVRRVVIIELGTSSVGFRFEDSGGKVLGTIPLHVLGKDRRAVLSHVQARLATAELIIESPSVNLDRRKTRDRLWLSSALTVVFACLSYFSWAKQPFTDSYIVAVSSLMIAALTSILSALFLRDALRIHRRDHPKSPPEQSELNENRSLTGPLSRFRSGETIDEVQTFRYPRSKKKKSPVDSKRESMIFTSIVVPVYIGFLWFRMPDLVPVITGKSAAILCSFLYILLMLLGWKELKESRRAEEILDPFEDDIIVLRGNSLVVESHGTELVGTLLPSALSLPSPLTALMIDPEPFAVAIGDEIRWYDANRMRQI